MTQLKLEEKGTAAEVRDALYALMKAGDRYALLDRLGCLGVVVCVGAAFAAAVFQEWRVVGVFGVLAIFLYWLATRYDSELAGDERVGFALALAEALHERDPQSSMELELELELRPHMAFAPEEKTPRADLGVRARYLQRWLTLRANDVELAVTRQTVEDQHGIEVQNQVITEWVEVLSEAPAKLTVKGLRADDGCLVAEEIITPANVIAVLDALEPRKPTA